MLQSNGVQSVSWPEEIERAKQYIKDQEAIADEAGRIRAERARAADAKKAAHVDFWTIRCRCPDHLKGTDVYYTDDHQWTAELSKAWRFKNKQDAVWGVCNGWVHKPVAYPGVSMDWLDVVAVQQTFRILHSNQLSFDDAQTAT